MSDEMKKLSGELHAMKFTLAQHGIPVQSYQDQPNPEGNQPPTYMTPYQLNPDHGQGPTSFDRNGNQTKDIPNNIQTPTYMTPYDRDELRHSQRYMTRPNLFKHKHKILIKVSPPVSKFSPFYGKNEMIN